MGVESETGQGTLFYFTLPFHQQIDDVQIIDEDTTLEAAKEEAALLQKDIPLILILANDAFSARVFAKTIKSNKVTILTDPDQLFTVVEQTYPSALILDENLYSHAEVQRFIENPPYDLPMITLPLPVSRQNRSSNLPKSVLDYLVKPVPRQLLLEVVNRLNLEIKTILVVDDDPAMARFVMQALRPGDQEEGAGIENLKILTALDGQEAMRYLHALPVGAVFLDLDLTDMNGLTLLNQMIQDREMCKIPVVIISASDPPATFTPQKKGLFSVVVNRSYHRNELAELVSAALQNITPVYDRPRKSGSANSATNKKLETEKTKSIK